MDANSPEEQALSTTDTDIAGWNRNALDEILSNDAGRPVLFTNARILTMDPLIGTMTGADILFAGSLIVAVGPSLFTAAQELTADGRYDETRGGRPHAYQGRYWIDGDRIDYLDDLGFRAVGYFRGDELHHVGYVMRRG